MRLLCLALLALSAVACDTVIECQVRCDDGATVVRTFPSCTALRDEIDRRGEGDTITACELEALQSCEESQCGASPI